MNRANRSSLLLSVILIVIFAIVLSRPELYSGEGGDITLFSYADMRKGDLRVKGPEGAAKRHPAGRTEKWVEIAVGLGKKEELYFLRDTDIDARGRAVHFSVKVRGINKEGRDYDPGEAKYPFFLQMIFDTAPEGLSLKKKLSLWYKSVRSEKIRNRQNIIYAFGNRLPKESIVNPYPGSAIISIGDDRDVDRVINVSRSLDYDYKLAFGEEMKGKLKRVVVGFEGYGDGGESLPVLVSPILLKRD